MLRHKMPFNPFEKQIEGTGVVKHLDGKFMWKDHVEKKAIEVLWAC